MSTKLPEVWLRGALPEIPAPLQPAAHALLQAREEVLEITKDFPTALLWVMPAGCASVGFHLQHIRGVIDRLFTYAEGKALLPEQLDKLKAEGKDSGETTEVLVSRLAEQIEKAIDKLKTIKEETVYESRSVGRAQLPSTVIGLIFHSAEHTMRHIGQLLVTARVLKDS